MTDETKDFFQCQVAKQCVIHAWNNGIGSKDVTFSDMKTTANEMHAGRPDKIKKQMIKMSINSRTGISTDVLIRWVNKQKEYHIVSHIPIYNITQLRKLLDDHDIQFIMLDTFVKPTMYGHAITIKKVQGHIFLFDSERHKKIKIDSAEKYKTQIDNKYVIIALYLVKIGPKPKSRKRKKPIIIEID